MRSIEKKKLCKCEHCGNEAEMVVTCSLEEHSPELSASGDVQKNKVKGSATCTHCGNEADMWIEL